MRISDTLSGEKIELDMTKKIRVYLCGVTVYDDSHMGHARTVIVFDVLRRYLEAMGTETQFVQNFTDVDDKIIARADDEDATVSEISERYISGYHRDFDALNVLRAHAYPRATEHMGEIVAFIGDLMERGLAYRSKNGIYFAVSKFPGYGKLSGKKTGELVSGARVEVDGEKRDPLDFALWKFADQPNWDTKLGEGRPGWHIECSAMSSKYLGSCFEIHGGGRDLVFPHHENEIAQSESRIGEPMAKAWMHVGMVTANGEKMSKSLKNTKRVGTVLQNWGPNIARIFCLSAHYSKPIDYSEELLRECVAKWRQAEICHHELAQAEGGGGGELGKKIATERRAEFDGALDDDMNTHLALSTLFDLARDVNKMAAGGELDREGADQIAKEFENMLDILGLRMQRLSEQDEEWIMDEIALRELARTEKRYLVSDWIRDRLYRNNVDLIDRSGKTVWVVREKISRDFER